MESKKETTAAILAAALLLIGSALGFSFSVSGDVGGLNQDIYAEIDDSFSSSVVLSENALSNNIKSSGGSLLERHWINDDYGNKAEVGVDIKDAGWYSYSYTLESSPDYASAGEALDVIDAKSIKAYSKADSHLGDSAESSIIISDKGKGASLLGYSNYAYSSSAKGINACLAEQMFNSASGDRITVNEYARQFDGDAAFNRVNVADGQVDSYFGAAVAGIGEYGYYYDYGYESGYWGVR